MQLPFALLSLLAPVAIEAAATKKAPCGNIAPSEEFLNAVKEMQALEKNSTAHGAAQFEISAARQINTYIHIIAADRTYQGGYVDQNTINQQMQMLNSNYAGSGFSFVLRDTDYTVDYNKGNLRSYDDEYYIKQSLRRGSYGDLNLYYFNSLFTGNTGWCYFPTGVSQGDNNFILDGCTIDAGTMPGGNYSPWNQGKITSHEVGHWFGLLHTFEGGCNGGDAVDDTPAQYSPTYGCPEGRDSCSQPGLDPIHNYMDYSDNACQNQFTRGQMARMASFYDYYRA